MNRMIKLFQTKADTAYERYLLTRDQLIKSQAGINTTEWHEAVVKGTELFTEYKIWAKAAEFLRKEEIAR